MMAWSPKRILLALRAREALCVGEAEMECGGSASSACALVEMSWRYLEMKMCGVDAGRASMMDCRFWERDAMGVLDSGQANTNKRGREYFSN